MTQISHQVQDQTSEPNPLTKLLVTLKLEIEG